MADMRDALKKAGLVSARKLKQAEHGDRVKRTTLGEDGLEAQRQQRAEIQRQAQVETREKDRQRQRDVLSAKEEEGRRTELESFFRDEDLLSREGGPKRFFELEDGCITFLDVSLALVKRLAQGDAAIVATGGLLRTPFTAVSGKAAHRLKGLDPDRIVFWNAGRRS